jgi:predicted PurR-regulated permease PerM
MDEPTRAPWPRAALPLFAALAGAIALVVLLVLVSAIANVLFVLFISLIVAASISGPVAALERRRVPPSLGSLLMFLLVAAVIALLVMIALPRIRDDIRMAIDRIPVWVEQWHDYRERYPVLKRFDDDVDAFIEDAWSSAFRWLLQVPATGMRALITLLNVIFISTILVSQRERILRFWLGLLPPRHVATVDHLARSAWNRLGGYMRAKTIVMVIVGTLSYVWLLLIGVPAALLLGVIDGVCSIVPVIGAWIARIPILLLAATQGGLTLALALIGGIVIQNLKGQVLGPVTEGRSMETHPLAAFIAVLIGAELYGWMGALVAVPVAAVVQVVVDEVIVPWRHTAAAAAQTSQPMSDAAEVADPTGTGAVPRPQQPVAPMDAAGVTPPAPADRPVDS